MIAFQPRGTLQRQNFLSIFIFMNFILHSPVTPIWKLFCVQWTFPEIIKSEQLIKLSAHVHIRRGAWEWTGEFFANSSYKTEYSIFNIQTRFHEQIWQTLWKFFDFSEGTLRHLFCDVRYLYHVHGKTISRGCLCFPRLWFCLVDTSVSWFESNLNDNPRWVMSHAASAKASTLNPFIIQ